MSEIRNVTARYYRGKLHQHGDSAKGVDWKDEASQQLRFSRLVRQMPCGEPLTLLDVGCGTGALVAHLALERPGSVTYLGIDFVPEMLEAARQKFAQNPGVRFASVGIEEVEGSFDFVLASGIFNLRLSISEEEWIEHFRKTISAMWSRCRRGIVFNALSAYRDFSAENLHYSDPGAVFDWCVKNLSRHVELDHAYGLFEYTLAVHRPEEILRRSPGYAKA